MKESILAVILVDLNASNVKINFSCVRQKFNSFLALVCIKERFYAILKILQSVKRGVLNNYLAAINAN